MSSADFFYFSLGGGFLILVGCAVAVTIQIWKILSDVKFVTEDIADVASDLTSLKDGIKVAGITLVQNLLEKAKKKGGAVSKHDKEKEE